MKISSGWSKGLKILTPTGLATRPTRERIRQSAINMLQPWISGSRVLDLFAGSGAVGIELVSRGASGARFVEVSSDALNCLRSNASEAAARATKQQIPLSPWSVDAGDAHLLVKSYPDSSFDLIWADPPYEAVRDFMGRCGQQIIRIMSAQGVFALECSSGDESWLIDWGASLGLELVKQRTYGVTLISVWQKA